MIRIDFKRDGSGFVQTWWIREDNKNGHSIMGRLLFTEEDWNMFHGRAIPILNNELIKFEEKK